MFVAGHRDRSSKDIQVFVSTSLGGAWELVIEDRLEDSRTQTDPLPVLEFEFQTRTVRYILFKLISYYGNGGGLQYFSPGTQNYEFFESSSVKDQLVSNTNKLNNEIPVQPVLSTSILVSSKIQRNYDK